MAMSLYFFIISRRGSKGKDGSASPDQFLIAFNLSRSPSRVMSSPFALFRKADLCKPAVVLSPRSPSLKPSLSKR